jgi:hypothetical protein
LANDMNQIACWDELDSPIRLGCRHYFCESCIRPWLDGHNHCPVYRIALLDALTILRTSFFPSS